MMKTSNDLVAKNVYDLFVRALPPSVFLPSFDTVMSVSVSSIEYLGSEKVPYCRLLPRLQEIPLDTEDLFYKRTLWLRIMDDSRAKVGIGLYLDFKKLFTFSEGSVCPILAVNLNLPRRVRLQRKHLLLVSVVRSQAEADIVLTRLVEELGEGGHSVRVIYQTGDEVALNDCYGHGGHASYHGCIRCKTRADRIATESGGGMMTYLSARTQLPRSDPLRQLTPVCTEKISFRSKEDFLTGFSREKGKRLKTSAASGVEFFPSPLLSLSYFTPNSILIDFSHTAIAELRRHFKLFSVDCRVPNELALPDSNYHLSQKNRLLTKDQIRLIDGRIRTAFLPPYFGRRIQFAELRSNRPFEEDLHFAYYLAPLLFTTFMMMPEIFW